MRAIHSIGTIYSILGACVASIAISACGGSQAPAPAAPPPAPIMSAAPAPTPAPVVSAAPAPVAAPVPEKKPEHKFHHPAIGMLLVEVAQVGLRPEQQTIVDAIKADLEKQADTTKAQRVQLNTDMADGVAAGKLDKAKIDADVKKLQQAADSTKTSVQDSINKLHQTHDAAQRKKIAESMLAKAEEMRAHGMGEMHEHGHGPQGMGPKGAKAEPAKPPQAEAAKGAKAEPAKPPQTEAAKGAKGEPAKPPQAEAAKGEPGKGLKGPGEHHGMGPHGMGPHGGMDKLGETLGLTAEQSEKLKTKLDALMKSAMTNMKTHQADMHKRMKTVCDAFATDKFDAKKVGVAEKFGDMIKMMTKGRIDFIEAVLSVLTPEQRAKFAEHIRQQNEFGDD